MSKTIKSKNEEKQEKPRPWILEGCIQTVTGRCLLALLVGSDIGAKLFLRNALLLNHYNE